MNLADHSLRVAALAALADYFGRQVTTAREAAEAAYLAEGAERVAIRLPGGEKVGHVTVIEPGPAVQVDEAALLSWAAENTPAEVEEYLDAAVLTDQEAIEWARANRDDLLHRRIRPVWRTELLKRVTDSGGYAVSETTGDSVKVAEVTPRKPTGAFALSQDPKRVRADRLVAALVAGELAHIVGDFPMLIAPAGGAE